MTPFRKNFNRVKNSGFFSKLNVTLLLLFVIIFLFNFNTDNFFVRGQQTQAQSGGMVGYIVRWLFAVDPVADSVLGEGQGGFIPKWSVDSALLCIVPRITAVQCTELKTTRVVLHANRTTIYTGDSATITWSTDNATTCSSTSASLNSALSSGVLSNQDGVTVTPKSTTTYRVSCSGLSSAEDFVTITVKKKPRFIEN